MTKTEFALLIDELLNEFDCLLEGLDYNDEGICTVSYFDGVFDRQIFVAYRFMNRARLRFKLMNQLDLLESVDPEMDLGF